MNTRRQKINHYKHQDTQNPQGQRNRGRAAEMKLRAAMQTNTADVGPLGLINGAGCLLCPPANITPPRAAFITHCNVQLMKSEKWSPLISIH